VLTPLPLIFRRRTGRTSSPSRSAPWSATGWTSSWPKPESRSRRPSRKPRSGISTGSSRFNVRAPFFLVQQLLPILGSGGSVVLLSSLAAHAAVGTLSAYAATKGAIDTLVKHFAAQLGPRGIRVNAVAPGVVDTDMSSFVKTDTGQKSAVNMHPLRRIARPEDIGPVIAFLASDEARWITGDSVRVDGGSKL